MLSALRLRSLGGAGEGRSKRLRRLKRLALPEDPVRRRLFWGAEAVFAVATRSARCSPRSRPTSGTPRSRWTWRSSTRINASAHFPPHDPWMSGETLNYYYFGHVVLAWPIKLLGLRPDAGYLLSWGVLIGAHGDRGLRVRGHAVGGRARGARRARAARRAGARGARRAALVAILGNLAGVRTWIRAEDPPQGLRVVRPVAGDPGHDQRVPVVLVHPRRPARARARAAVHGARARVRAADRAARAARGRCCGARSPRRSPAALALGALYAINSWSYPVAAGLLAAAVVVWLRTAGARGGAATASSGSGLVLVASFVLILPFILNFDPEARGIGVVARRAARSRKWLGDMALIYGILLWPLSASYAAPAARRPARWRWTRLGPRGGVVGGSLLAPSNLTGARVLAVGMVVGIAAALDAGAVAARALPLGAGRRRRRAAARSRSCCTCATRSTTARWSA